MRIYIFVKCRLLLPLQAYPMSGKRRGSVLIFHIQYHTGTQHRRSSISHATMPNVEDLKILFAQLSFRIDEVTDSHLLTARVSRINNTR